MDFDNPVNVTGVPQLALNSGAGAVAYYSSGSGTNVLTFTYTVSAGQNADPLDAASSAALTLPGGSTITDTFGYAAELTLPAPGGPGSLGANAGLVVDTTPATVTGVGASCPNNSRFLVGAVGTVIDIDVSFSKVVDVASAAGPVLVLNDPANATYIDGSGTNTLVFSYTLGGGQYADPLDAAGQSALSRPPARSRTSSASPPT